MAHRCLGGARQVALAHAEASGSAGRSRYPRGVASRGGMRQLARSSTARRVRADTASEPNQPYHLQLREAMSDMFLMNEFSGVKAQSLLKKAAAAGARGVSDLGRAGATGRHPGNCARDVLRALLKAKDMPSLYWAKAILANPTTEAVEEHNCHSSCPMRFSRGSPARCRLPS